jgi:predicted DNA-binding antitoxin AbrB/MazE fold protein
MGLVSKTGTVKATVDAVFQDGVFKPERRPDLPEGERVRITVEKVGLALPDDILHLAASVYEGLSIKDIDEIEEMARHRPLFTSARR